MAVKTEPVGTEYIGRRTRKLDALERVMGKATFGADLHLPDMLHGNLLRSPHPHARIKRIDTSKPRVQAYRAPGGTTVCFAVESHMDEVAERLGMDPLQFRMINEVEEGDRMPDD